MADSTDMDEKPYDYKGIYLDIPQLQNPYIGGRILKRIIRYIYPEYTLYQPQAGEHYI